MVSAQLHLVQLGHPDVVRFELENTLSLVKEETAMNLVVDFVTHKASFVIPCREGGIPSFQEMTSPSVDGPLLATLKVILQAAYDSRIRLELAIFALDEENQGNLSRVIAQLIGQIIPGTTRSILIQVTTVYEVWYYECAIILGSNIPAFSEMRSLSPVSRGGRSIVVNALIAAYQPLIRV